MAASRTRSRRPKPRRGRHPAAEAAEVRRLRNAVARTAEQVRSGQDWQQLLHRVAPLHDYGFANALLILDQRPDATHLGDYGSWSTVGRHVQTGARSVRVLSRRFDATGRPRSEHVRHLFDITQTRGGGVIVPPAAPLPPGRVPAGLWDALRGQVERAGFRIDRLSTDDPASRASGVDWPQRLIRLAPGLDQTDAVRALAHELAHLQMHTAKQLAGGCEGLVALEADSVAYLITRAAGMTPTGYRFPLVSAWPVDHDRPVAVLQVGNAVMAAGHDLVVALEADALSPQQVETNERLRQHIAAGVEQAAALRARAETPPARPPAPPVVRVIEPPPGLTRLLAAHEAACEFYQDCYAGRAGAEARDYLASRGLGWAGEAGQPWRIGYAPGPRADRQWNALYRHLRAAGFTDDELLTAGVAKRATTGNLIDRFLGRIMFPIRDHRLIGRPVVGFTARVMPAEEHSNVGGKYVNTEGSPIFKKGELLYGWAEQQGVVPRGTGVGVVEEGTTDVLAVAGLRRSDPASPFIGYAALGTAFTEAHAAAVTGNPDLGPRLILAYDGDNAGRKAHRSTFDHLARQWEPSRDGAHIDGLVLPDGVDPASAGPDRLRALLAADLPRADRIIVDRSIARILARHPDPEDVIARAYAARATVAFIAARPLADQARLGAHVAARLDLEPLTMPTLLAEHHDGQPRAAKRTTARSRDQPATAGNTAPPTVHRTETNVVRRPAAPTPGMHLAGGVERG